MAVNITPELLHRIAQPYKKNRKRHDAQEANITGLAKAMNLWFPVYDINTKLRVAHFLAQSCVETQDFLYMTENPAHGGKEYEPDTRAGRNVGNHFPGDGPKYIGRGLLHLTGRENYQKYGDKFHEDLVNHPERVAEDYSLAVRSACAFWQSRGLNRLADDDNFMAITYRVNGGYNGRPRREKALSDIKKALHI
ncbi:glycoside hydrolase family 19 protein [Erwinia pyrifoliae]|uniref:glycoside hydrolase family 19 protein n=1 Tax=Erwinia pyrifoliae TaxID=79967 RepID=UPI0001B71331|nr:glycoside hydrolase family 19 protein [Erwinia pyrifoliae]CAX53399.1 putative lysozyme, phage-related [Erwinia pyrifoliae Ep1/96]